MNVEATVKSTELADGIIEIALNRPERRNALTLDMLEELGRALDVAVGERGARVVLLTGEGPDFCAGADLSVVHTPDSRTVGEAGLGGSRVWDRFGEVPVPVIAVVRGHAMTGGFHLALCCDLIIAAETAIFQDTHARFGLVPGSGEPQRYSRRLGIALAREMLYTSEPLSGVRAAELGIACRAVPADQLTAETMELARRIASNSARAISYIKQMLNSGFGRPYGEAQWDDDRLNHRGRLNLVPDADRDERLRRFAARKVASK